MIKAVFLDFDGTVFSHYTEQIPPSAIKAIRALKEKGIIVYLCSGRAIAEMKDFDISELPIDGMILSNGQMVIDSENNIIYENTIEGELKEKVIDMFNKKEIAMYICTDDDIFLNFANKRVKDITDAVSSPLPAIKEYTGQKIYMCSPFFDDEETGEYIKEYFSDADITTWHNGAFDIVPKGSSKTIGIDKVIEKYGIDLSETMGIGDGENDIKMLKHCAIGVAMGNSIEEVKEAADYVCAHIDEDGVYEALKHFNVI